MSSVVITPADDSLALTLLSEVKATAFDKEAVVTFDANIKAPALSNEEYEQRKNVNIVAVIDVSGSMSGEPLRLVGETLDFIIGQLKSGDHLSVVTFGDSAKLLFSFTNMDEEGKKKASALVSKLSVDGMTNLSAGLELGFNQLCDLYNIERVNAKLSPEPRQTTTASSAAVSSVLVLTDGHANRGISQVPQLVDFVASAFAPIMRAASAANGAVSLHSFGFSAGHSPELMTRVAEAGNGVFYYVPSGDKIGDVFADCLGGLLSVIAINVVLELEVQASGARITQVHTPFAITTVEAGRRLRVDVGQMYSEQSRDVLIEVTLPAVAAADLDVKVLTVNLTSLNRKEVSVSTHAIGTLDRVAADSPVLEKQKPNQNVVDQKARYETANALKEALAHKTAGRSDQARKVLEKARQTLSNRGYAGYSEQLATATTELSATNQGYLWGQMRSHMAQASCASEPIAAESAMASAPSYGNAMKSKMVSTRRAQQAAAPQAAAPSQAPGPYAAPQGYGYGNVGGYHA